MKRHAILLLVGVLMIVIGIVLAVALPLMAIKDPADAAVKTLEFASGGGTQSVQLDKGTYDVWHSGFTNFWGEVTITDGSGSTIFDSSEGGSTTTINGKFKLGSFDADGGSYNVSCDTGVTVYITEPIDVGGIFGGMCGGLLVAAIGAVVALVGFIMWLSSRKGQQVVYAQPPYPGYPPQQYPAPGYPPQPQPPQPQPPQPQPPQPQQPPSPPPQ